MLDTQRPSSSVLVYIDDETVKTMRLAGSYRVGTQPRFAYIAPLPALALIIVRDVQLSELVNKIMLAHCGWTIAGTGKAAHSPGRNDFGHFPDLTQSKISLAREMPGATARVTLADLIRVAPQYLEVAAAQDLGMHDASDA